MANGSSPLGRQRFFVETGIKESDWLGKFWPRWSLAVAEAGFEPLKRQQKQGPIERAEALSKVLLLTRRLGRLPTIPEMKLERKADPTFPSKSLRAISKSHFLGELSDFCHSHQGYQDVEQILNDIPVSNQSIELLKKTDELSQPGTVYLVLAGKHYKIGITAALYRRVSQIANGHPNGAELIHSFQTDDARGIEIYWHTRFADKRVKGVNIASGEWFALSKRDVAAFCRRKRFM